MTTITKTYRLVAILSALARRLPRLASTADEGGLSAYARFGSEHNVKSAQVLVNRPSR